MATVAELIAYRDQLMAARGGSIRRFRDQSGEEVEYKSDAELKTAIAAVTREIDAAQSGRTASTIIFRTSKGL